MQSIQSSKDNISLFREFQQFLIEEYSHGRRTVLIVDEAQNLGEKALEELRLLTNINADRDQLLQIVLVGQPELLAIFSTPEMAQIAQRVSVEFHLEPLDLAEVKKYIEYRLEVAGTTKEVFEIDAIKAIFYFSGGVPRLVNTLCDYALVHAYANNKEKVDLDIAMQVRKGRKIGGINQFVTDPQTAELIRQELLSKTGIDLAGA